jgi:hypothetical protein
MKIERGRVIKGFPFCPTMTKRDATTATLLFNILLEASTYAQTGGQDEKDGLYTSAT